MPVIADPAESAGHALRVRARPTRRGVGLTVTQPLSLPGFGSCGNDVPAITGRRATRPLASGTTVSTRRSKRNVRTASSSTQYGISHT